ncbi:MAG: ATP-binding protein [Promethearchaeota archaeon]
MTLIRGVGVAITFDFYLEMRKDRHQFLLLGWISWFFSGLMPILSDIGENEVVAESFLLLNSILTPLGGLFLIVGIIHYFTQLNLKQQFYILGAPFFLHITLLLFLDFHLAGRIVLLSFYILAAILIFLGLIHRKELQTYIRGSIKWFYVSAILFVMLLFWIGILLLSGESYGLYDSTNSILIISNYLIGNSFSLCVLVLFIRSEQSLSSRGLRESEERYRMLFETTPVSILLSDNDGNILEFNQKFLEETGYNSFDIQNIKVRDFYFDLNEGNILIEKILTTNSIKDYEIRIKNKDGTARYVLLNIVRIELSGTPVLYTTALDITERKEAENVRLELEKQREDFVTMASHELRTPLTVLSGYYDFLSSHLENLSLDQKQGIFRIIKKNLDRLNRLSIEVGSSSLIEKESFQLVRSDINFPKFIEQICTPYKYILKTGFELKIYQEEEKVVIQGDKERLQQAFDNIMDNAIKQTVEQNRKIVVSISNNPNEVILAISDNGVGIEPENLEKIFKKFVSIETETRIPGTGLGLYIAQEIVRAHGGIISAESKGKNQGATFVIRLPRT